MLAYDVVRRPCSDSDILYGAFRLINCIIIIIIIIIIYYYLLLLLFSAHQHKSLWA